MIHQHPLAYLVGVEGLALLRAWAGDFDREFVRERLAEVRRLLDDPALAGHPGVEVARGDTLTGYRQWAPEYDEPRNGLFDVDEPVVHEILDALPPGVALDAACGTGRYAAHLTARGHQVVGVDSSPEMLGRARTRVPRAAFLPGDVHRLPLPDDAADLAVCGLALTHVPDLRPVLAEFARVLRPGGHLVIADVHHELVRLGSVPKALGPAGEPGLVATYRHTAGDYLRAALPAGLEVRRCEEPHRPPTGEPPPAPPVSVTGWDEWPWSLMDLTPAAVRAVVPPSLIIWHFRLTGSGAPEAGRP
ncbi:MAG TPA: class I SAM-dependent methyltransferase [Pseudonocardiaceae bacterium]